MSTEEPIYFSYLVRLWRVADDSHPVWRASLEEPASGRRIGFTGLESLFSFLRDACSPAAENEADEKSAASSIPRQPLAHAPANFPPPEEVSE